MKFLKAPNRIFWIICFLIIHVPSSYTFSQTIRSFWYAIKQIQHFENGSDNAVNVLPSHLKRTEGKICNVTYLRNFVNLDKRTPKTCTLGKHLTYMIYLHTVWTHAHGSFAVIADTQIVL